MAKMNEESRFKKAVTAQVLNILRNKLSVEDAVSAIIISFDDSSYMMKAKPIFEQAATAVENETWYCGICMTFYPIDHFSIAQRRNIFAKMYAYCPKCVIDMNTTKPSAVARREKKAEEEKEIYTENEINILVDEQNDVVGKQIESEEQILPSAEAYIEEDTKVQDEEIDNSEESLEAIVAKLLKKVAKKKIKYAIEIILYREEGVLHEFLKLNKETWSVFISRKFVLLSCITEEQKQYGLDFIKPYCIKIDIEEINE